MKTLSYYLFILICLILINPSQVKAQTANEPIVKDSLRGFPLKQHGEVLTVPQLDQIFANHPEARLEFKAARGNRDLSMVLGYAGGFLIGWPLGQSLGGGDPNWVMAGIGAGLIIIAIPLGSAFKKRSLNAVDIYNKGLQETTEEAKVSFHLENTNSGIGLVMKF